MTRALDGEIIPPGLEIGDDSAAPDETEIRKKFWRSLKRAARQIPFTQDLVAAYYCAMDPEVPMRVRATLLGALAYFVSPVDALPDLLIGVGYTDDAAVLLAAITMVATHITPAHRKRAQEALKE